MRELLESEPNLHIKQAEVAELILEEVSGFEFQVSSDTGREQLETGNSQLETSRTIRGIKLRDGRTVSAQAVIITTGTFLNGLIHCGEQQYPAGRSGEPNAVLLGESLKALGLRGCRLKTGTPPRLDGRSIDWSKFKVQPGDDDPTPFSFRTRRGSGTSASGRRRGMLVVAETAVALMLLVSAGLLVNSFVRLRHVNPGFDPRRTLAAEVSLPDSRYPHGDEQAAFVDRLLDRVRTLPGVVSASIVTVLPESSNFNRMALDVEGRVYTPLTRPDADQYEVTPDYFRTLSIPLRSGRLFADETTATTPMALTPPILRSSGGIRL